MPKNVRILDGSEVNKSEPVTIYFEGKPITAYKGESVASALYASGMRIFTRSFKYHRPRGLLCVSGRCPNCMMNVDGSPNVRSCVEPVREGLRIEHQNAWPSLSRDFFSIVGKLNRFLPVGFYYKMFHKPRFIWPIARKILRNMAGLGSVKNDASPNEEFDQMYIHTDVTVVGGGPAGISAALEASKLGVKVVLVDDQIDLGGRLRYKLNISNLPEEFSELTGSKISKKLVQEIKDTDIQVLSNTKIFGLYEGNNLGGSQGNRLIKIRTKATVIATGTRDRSMVFRNNDLPGVFFGTGVQRLIQLYGVKPGDNCLVISANIQGLELASDLLDSGVNVVVVADARPSVPQNSSVLKKLNDANIPLLTEYTIVEAKGNKSVKGAILAKLDEDGNIINGSEKEILCDTICLSVGFDGENELLYQGRIDFSYDPNLCEMVPKTQQSMLHYAGDITGIHDLQISIMQGKVAGLQATFGILNSSASTEDQKVRETIENNIERLRELDDKYRNELSSRSLLSVASKGGKGFVCICEDVIEKDISDSVEEGFDEIETLKRYSTVNMGPCQGKICSIPSMALCAKVTGRSINETGVTTSRPPLHPVTLGALSGGSFHPVKLSSIHYKHLEHGASLMDMGEWKRPYVYTTPEDEYKSVRERVGIIDVSTLGRLDVKGKDASKLVDLIYTQKLSNLKIGRIRYSVICDESGTILDDGTISRLAEDHYFVTTTTGNIEFVEQWFKWWTETLDLCTHITNVTAAFSSINIAGPMARDALSKLTDLDLTSASSPYMSVGQAKVAGVPSLLLRIGFVGETGWEIHFPAEYGEYVWSKLLESGQEYGITPFGVEAQRILRLDKRHLIVGQDTDALSTPMESDMTWVMKFDKPDFIGKQSLLRNQAKGAFRRQVGFIVEDPGMVEDGNGVVDKGKPVGFVTSARLSPHLGKYIGLALVPPEIADRKEIFIHNNGKFLKSRVVSEPFYDSEGKKLRV